MSELKFKFKMPDDESLAEYISIKGEKGEKGDPTKLSQLENDTGFVTANTTALTNYYTKAQTDSAIDADVEALETELGVPDGFFTDTSETVTGEGTTITLTDTTNAVFKDIKLYGDTEQSGTPTPDSPVDVQTVTGEQTIVFGGNSYVIDFGTIELCKLGDYQDYIWKDGDEWKIRKATASYTFSGDEGWVKSGSSTSAIFVGALTGSKLTNHISMPQSGASLSLSNYFEFKNSIEIGKFGAYNWSGGIAQAIRFCVDAENITDIADFTAWLQSHPTKLYYALTTPTDTIITDSTLIDQLEAVRVAGSTKDTTTITVFGDRPVQLYAEAYKNNWEGTISGLNNGINELFIANHEYITFSFENIDELKASSGVTNGTYVETYGYYKVGDGGSGKYKIRYEKADDVIDDNKIIGVNDNLVGELANASKIGTKLGVNLWTRHENIDDVKARIDTYKYMGVTDIVIVIQLDGAQCTVTEDIDVVNQAIAYAKSKKIEVNTIKFHCTNSNLNDSAQYRALYQQHCEDLLGAIEGTTIERVIILNEKNAWFNDSATQEQVDICSNMIAHFKGLGYEVSITVAGLRYFLDCYYFHPEITNSFDFIAVNDYPAIGDNKQFTSEKEVKEAYATLYAFASQIKSWYPSKDFILSEIGVQNVWESLSSPANWRIKDMEGATNSEGKIIPLYFRGLLDDSRLNKVFSEVWLWYSEYYSEYPEQTKIFRDKFVGGNN